MTVSLAMHLNWQEMSWIHLFSPKSQSNFIVGLFFVLTCVYFILFSYLAKALDPTRFVAALKKKETKDCF